MIEVLIGILAGVVVGFSIGLIVVAKRKKNRDVITRDKEAVGAEEPVVISDLAKQKSENLAKLRDFISERESGETNNKEVRDFLEISDATACRYLDDLEKEGLIRQVGSDGPNVYYKKI